MCGSVFRYDAWIENLQFLDNIYADTMIFSRITSEAWDQEEVRIKERIDDKILYYRAGEGDFIKNEIDMMKKAQESGIRCPKVYSYTSYGNLEICIFEYFEGHIMNKEDINLVRDHLRKANMTRQKEASIHMHLLLSSDVEFENAYQFYQEWVSELNGMNDFFQANAVQIDEKDLISLLPTNEFCVLTHGDLSEDNVIVNGSEVCIIDWECSGFFPIHVSRAMSSFETDYCEYDEIVRLLQQAIRSIRLKELENMRKVYQDISSFQTKKRDHKISCNHN